jgi:hypothetical protein
MAAPAPNPSSSLPTLRESLEAWRTGGNPIAACLLRRLKEEDARRAERAGKAARS